MSQQVFDSDIFGVDYFRITDTAINKENILQDIAKLQTPYIIDVKINANDIQSNLILKRLGFREICTQAVLENTDINIKSQNNKAKISKILTLPKEIINQHGKNFIYNRFTLDNLVDSGIANKIYAKWVSNSLKNTDIKIAHIDNDFCTFKIQNDKILLDLLSVLYKKQGTGTKLLKAINNYAFKNNIKKIQATTETSNKIAFDLYQKNGFRVVDFISCLNLTKMS